MKNLKRMLALLMAMVLLLMASGYAEEQGGTESEALPTENTDVPVDEPLTAEGEAAQASDSLTIDQTSVTLDYSQSAVLTATASAGGESVAWTSSDEGVARISANSGESIEIVGISAGTVTITCTSGDQQQSCEVTVTAPGTLEITGVDYPSTYRMAGRGWKLRRGVLASNVDLATVTTVLKAADGTVVGSAYTHTFGGGVQRYEIDGLDNYVPFSWVRTEGVYTWTLSATDVSGRMVSMNLPINAVAEGETAISNEPGAQSPVIVVTEITLDSTEVSMQKGEARQITATVNPGDAMNSGVIWVSDDPSVAVVSASGEVTGVGIGTAIVTCRTLGNPGVSASCAVTVLGEPTTDESAQSGEAVQGNGRNLVLNGAFEYDQKNWDNWGDPTTREFIELDGKTWCHIVSTANAQWQGIQQNPYNVQGITVNENERYTISARVRGTVEGQKFTMGIHWGDSNGILAQEWNTWTIGPEEQRIVYTATAAPGSECFNLMLGVDDVNSDVIHDFLFTDVKMEAGDVVTDWSPAPEDESVQNDGRNLLINSAFEHGQEGWNNWGEPTAREVIQQDGKAWCHIVSTANAQWQGVQQNAYETYGIIITGEDPYTFSAVVKGSAENTKFTMGIHWLNEDGILSQAWNSWTIGTEEQSIAYTMTAAPGSKCFNLMLGVDDVDSDMIHDVYFTNVKLEHGDAATDWSLAPEEASSFD